MRWFVLGALLLAGACMLRVLRPAAMQGRTDESVTSFADDRLSPRRLAARIEQRPTEDWLPSPDRYTTAESPSLDEQSTRLLHDWFCLAPEDALAWVGQLPDPETRDAWHLKLLRWALQKEPTAAVPLLERISDENLRTEAAVGLVRDWARDDFENATTWVLTESSPPRREKLLRELVAIAVERADPVAMSESVQLPVACRRRSTLGQDALAVVVMFLLACVVGASVVLHRRGHRPQHPRLSLAEMQAHVGREDVLILDARDAHIFAGGRLPGAMNLPLAEWATRSFELREALSAHRAGLVIVYCASAWCGEADELQHVLVETGHRQVGVFTGGFDAWLAAGLPVERSR